MTKNVIITGSTSGIGKELVKLYLNAGYHVFAGYRNESLIEHQDNVEYFYIDMKDRSSIKNAADFIKTKTSKTDILINVAGCVIAGPIELLDTDKLREQFDVNVFSHIEFTQNLLPILENGRIINISSVASFGHFPFISPYCASKRALDIFFNAFAIENHKNIKVISIKPGVIATPLWDKSVKINSEILCDCKDYEKEMEFMKINALANSNRGLNVVDVAKFIKNISEKPNPKSSYTLGIDSKAGHLLSFLPQDFVNKMVKFALKLRLK